GIIHSGNKVFMLEQADEIVAIIKEQTERVKAYLSVLSGEPSIQMPSDIPNFQARNWSLAHAVFEYVKKRDGLASSNIDQSLKTVVPGRMDITKVQGKTVVMDGAHNEQKMQAFISSF